MTSGSKRTNTDKRINNQLNIIMKRIVLFISFITITLIGSSNVSAQGKYGPDSTECIKYLSYYTEYYKQKNYDAALPNWRQAYKYCPPTSRYSLLSDGATLLKKVIQKNASNPIYKDALVDSLMTIYDQRIQYWPKYAVSSMNNKALDMYNYMKDEPMKLYAGLTEAVNELGVQARPNIYLFQISTAIDLYKDGMLDPETVINAYETAVDNISKMTPKNDVEKRSNDKVVEDIESLFITSQVASCDNLIALFSPRYEAAPEDLALAKNIVKIMSITEGCTDNDLFLNAVTTMYNLEPSHTSAYYLYKLYAGRSDVGNAVKYMNEAIAAAESDAATDAAYQFELAAFCYKNGENAKAYAAAQAAAELDPSIAGKAYMLMGTIWGSLVCPGNDIEQRSKYWVAVDYMTKAKNADASLTEEANNHIRQYAAYYPQTAEAFMYDVTDGQSYTVSCGGMRAVTTVRTQK